MVARMLVPTLIFSVSYLSIAGLRIPLWPRSRPVAALVGALLMVATGAIRGRDAWAAVDGATLGLLLGMMLLAGGLRRTGALDDAARWTGDRLGARPTALLWVIVFASGALSAILLNDAVCLIGTPLVLSICDRARLRPLPYLLALATGSNVGSVATLTGNPQNMIVGRRSGWPYAAFLARLGPVAAIGLAVTAAILTWLFWSALRGEGDATVEERWPPVEAAWRRRRGFALVALLGATVGFIFGGSLTVVALGAGSALLVASGRQAEELLAEVDWSLLLFFAALFVVVAGFDRTGLPAAAFRAVAPSFGATAGRQMASFSAFSLMASNAFSNVPFVLVASPWIPRFADPRLMWLTLAGSSTLAGNLTIVGSVANLIVVEGAARRSAISFWDYARAGIPITLATTALMVGWLWLTT
ncbi:MAG: ArsB/NhaD family transporter [Deltaproteobacteria bacterium]